MNLMVTIWEEAGEQTIGETGEQPFSPGEVISCDLLEWQRSPGFSITVERFL